jgi:hypothetical protein
MPVKQEKLRSQERPGPTPALRKIQFGSIAKKKPDSRASYPQLPDPQGQYAAIAARIIDRSAQVEAIVGALDVDKAELKRRPSRSWIRRSKDRPGDNCPPLTLPK